jgi:hypothetical protein
VVVTLLLAATLGGIGYLELRRQKRKQARMSSSRRCSAGKGVKGASGAGPGPSVQVSGKKGWRAWLEAADDVAESVIFFPVDAWRRRKLRREVCSEVAQCHFFELDPAVHLLLHVCLG